MKIYMNLYCYIVRKVQFFCLPIVKTVSRAGQISFPEPAILGKEREALG